MITYAFIKVGVPQNASSRSAFYNNVTVNVGGFMFSLQDLEHGLLRGNQKAPYALKKPFSKQDPRLGLIVKRPDSRIHFALNCGAKSCPPVRNYSSEHLMEELRVVATSFCEDEANVLIDRDRGELYLSRIFDWYRVDFCDSSHQLPHAIADFLRGTRKQSLERLVEEGERDRRKAIKVRWLDYNWSVNASDYVSFDSSVLKANTSGFVGGAVRLTPEV
jgi:hypothetical protein